MNERAHHTSDTTRSDAGFSIVELLVVLVLLGILASISIFAVRGITDRGETSACSTDAKTVQDAVQVYMSEHAGLIPATGTGPDRFERTLVEAKLLGSVSALHDVEADGTIVIVDASC